MRPIIQRALPCVGWSAVALACSAPPISPELRTARDAYAEAEAGVAAELAPAELAEAKQALQTAEGSFRHDHKSQETKDHAYIAERRAQLAAIYGQIEQKKREKKELETKLDRLEKKYANMTAEELEQAQAALDAKKRELERERETLSKTSAQLAEAQKQLGAALSSLDQIGKVKEEQRGIVITLSGSVLFATGKYELLPIAREKLNDVAKALKDQGYREIVVEGHTDSRGSESANQELSLHRARSVREHLVSQGIESAKISARGVGESTPVASNDSAEGRANNRRVELIVVPE